MQVTTISVWESQTALNFPTPDYSHISPTITVSEPIRIHFSDIFIDEILKNIARADGTDDAHIADLVQSFSKGTNTNCELPAVIDRGEGAPKRYELLYGYGRVLALQELSGIDGWWFNVITASQTELEDVQLDENETKEPKQYNKEMDITQVKIKQIREGRIEKNEDAVEENLRKIFPRRKTESINRLVQAICGATGIKVRIAYYGTESKIKHWLHNHAHTTYALGGKWDAIRQQYGYNAKIGGIYRTFGRALQKYADTKFTSYVVAHCDKVSKGNDLNVQREKIIESYVTLRANHAIVYGADVKFLTLLGFYPQEVDKDNWSDIIFLDQQDIDERVTDRIKLLKQRYRDAIAA